MTNKEKQIGDMYLAAACIAYGAKLCRIDKKDPHRQKFCFEQEGIGSVFIYTGGKIVVKDSPTLDEIETFYISKTLVFPTSYPDALRGIKAAIHSE